jgi:hypothetical protein
MDTEKMGKEELIKRAGAEAECGLNKKHFGEKCESCLFCCDCEESDEVWGRDE